VTISRADTNEEVGTAPRRIEGQSMRFDVPSPCRTGEDGTMDVSAADGHFGGMTDWAPDAGHGTVEVRTDVPWLSETPTSDTLAPGASVSGRVRAASTTPAGGHLHGRRPVPDQRRPGRPSPEARTPERCRSPNRPLPAPRPTPRAGEPHAS
jgi:hypothetical protein